MNNIKQKMQRQPRKDREKTEIDNEKHGGTQRKNTEETQKNTHRYVHSSAGGWGAKLTRPSSVAEGEEKPKKTE